MDPHARYMQLGALATSFPELAERPMPEETLRRCARLRAHLSDAYDLVGTTNLDNALQTIRTTNIPEHAYAAQEQIKTVLFNALALAEIKAPGATGGAFIAAGNTYEGMAAISKVLGEAKKGVLMVDPYMDHKALEYALLTREGVAIRLLADAASVKPSLKPTVDAWEQQYKAIRPLEAKVSPPGALHDRLVTIDGQTVFLLTQSFNAFAARSPATIQRVDADSAALKIPSYEALWSAASVLS